MTTKEYKQYKELCKESMRDNMDNIEIILTDLSEEITKVARKDIERNLGEIVITKQNRLNYEYKDE